MALLYLAQDWNFTCIKAYTQVLHSATEQQHPSLTRLIEIFVLKKYKKDPFPYVSTQCIDPLLAIIPIIR